MAQQATRIELNEKELVTLTQITRRHQSEQQQVIRAKIVLLAAQGDTNGKIAKALSIHIDTARFWRDRWAMLQGLEVEQLSIAERLVDVARPGKPSKISAEQRCQIAALACETPASSGRPISQWTEREIADEIMAKGIIEQISPRHAARLLKKRLAAASLPLLADRRSR
ncbi:MAG: helix-turn-helix domain-containing protein [Ktedonobacteraceae bacterium]